MIPWASVRFQEFKQHIQGHMLMNDYITNYFSMFCTYLCLKISLAQITFFLSY